MQIPSEDSRDIALCRSILYEALAAGFGPPSRETRDLLVSAPRGPGLHAAALLLDASSGSRLGERVRDLAARGADLDRMEEDYQHLFGHSVRGEVSLFETEYGRGTVFQQPQELADLGGFIRAFGLVPDPGVRERVDHVSCECEFMLFLARREAHHIETGDAENLATTREAERLFLKHHLGRFGPTFARRLARLDRGRFFGALGNLLLQFLQTEARRFKVKPGADSLPMRKYDDDDVPMACGATDEPIQIGHPPQAGGS